MRPFTVWQLYLSRVHSSRKQASSASACVWARWKEVPDDHLRPVIILRTIKKRKRPDLIGPGFFNYRSQPFLEKALTIGKPL